MRCRVLLMLAALLLLSIPALMFIGCSSGEDKVVSSDSGQVAGENTDKAGGQNTAGSAVNPGGKNSGAYGTELSGGQESRTAGVLTPPGYLMTLENGYKIYSISKTTDNGAFLFRFKYEDQNGFSRERVLNLSSFGDVSIFDANGGYLFGYNFQMTESNKVLYSANTTADSLHVIYETIGEKVQATFQYNDRNHFIEFNNANEAFIAKDIYSRYYDNGEMMLGMSEYELSLYEKFRAMNEFFDVPNTFDDNPDANVVAYLMNDPEFLVWVRDADPEIFLACGKDCICGIAGLISIASSFGGPITMAIAMPAHGVSAACAIAGILSAFFD